MSTERPLRADARRNALAVIEAARTLFAENGVDVPMEEVGRAAGVGKGTLYRHFPTREFEPPPRCCARTCCWWSCCATRSSRRLPSVHR